MRAEFELTKKILAAQAPPEEKVRQLGEARRQSAAMSDQMDLYLVAEIGRLHEDMARFRETHGAMRATLEKYSMPPLFPAVFLKQLAAGPLVLMPGGGRRVVNSADGVNLEALRPGDDVLLSPELNLLVGVAGDTGVRGGEVGIVDRLLDGNRAVVSHRDDKFIVTLAGPLCGLEETLANGDSIRFDRNQMLAYEKLPASDGSHLFFQDPPKASFAAIGGLDAVIRDLKRAVSLRLVHPEAAMVYGAAVPGAYLFEGPPGTGKTMLAGALAEYVGELSGTGRSLFMNVRPGELRSMWYGETERNFRELFRAARIAGEREERVPVIVFFDELDSIAATRGRFGRQIDDRIVQAFASEIDGITNRGNILLIGATNRRDAIDPALLRPGRFGDHSIRIPRPNMAAARSILDKHLYAGAPYGGDGREEIIDAAVSRLYSPNGVMRICKLVLRDASEREVKAPDLMSGASLAKIAQAALSRACYRDIDTGEPGVRVEDIFAGIDEEMESLSRLLTPLNARDHIQDLPDDVDVVRVDRPKGQRARSGHRHLAVA
jgi:proteasome-associated ATPase